jgi:5-(carboxyamino)imidazole ribonucleotide mutase
MHAPGAVPIVGVVMGSDSDLPQMRAVVEALAEFEVSSEVRVLSAHRTPDDALEYARTAADRGLRVIVAGAGGAAHLAGVLAAVTPLPVIGVPLAATPLAGFDAMLSTVQMPAGVPVATVAVGGGRNAGLLAVRILAQADPELRRAVERFQAGLADAVRAKDAAVREQLPESGDFP